MSGIHLRLAVVAALFTATLVSATAVAVRIAAATESVEARCDRLAAHPLDRDKPGELAARDTIASGDIAPAIAACTTAAASPKAHRRHAFQLGRALEFGRRYPEAARAYRTAADAGSTSAMVALAVLHINGLGVATDLTAAREWLEKAAADGDALAMTNLGSLHGAGAGVPIDLRKANEWFTKAAERNSAEAMFQLGLMSQDGDVAPKDDAAARTWFEKAAAHEHSAAIFMLGTYAEEGRGGAKNDDAAIGYYTRAAGLGEEDARKALERLRCRIDLKDADGKHAGRICLTSPR